MGHPNVERVERRKEGTYWDYFDELVKANVLRESHELPAIAAAAEIRGKHVIEAGCGPGRMLLPFFKVAETITAVDESDWTIKVCEKLIRENRLWERIQVVQAPLVGMPFDDGISESTYCVGIIHHDKGRWQKIVKEMARVTKPGNPVVVGFISGEKELPLLEAIVKQNHVQKMKEFDVEFPKWIKEQGWSLDIKKVPLSYVFKSAEWAQEVFMNTLMRGDFPQSIHTKVLDFLKAHSVNKKPKIDFELRLYVIRAPNEN